MSIWNLDRIPEPEEMDDAAEVESYSSAAAARHLEAIDNTFVDHLGGLISGRESAAGMRCGLDIGTGPAEIPIKVLQRFADLRMIGMDRSRNMLLKARRNSARAGVAQRLALLAGDGHWLPFPKATFSMVICNSVLHHAHDPATLIREMARVARPEAPLLLRDLRRPSRPALRFHLWRHGRHYQGLMRKLFADSVRAAYTFPELIEIVEQSKVERLEIFRFRGAHLGIERRPIGA